MSTFPTRRNLAIALAGCFPFLMTLGGCSEGVAPEGDVEVTDTIPSDIRTDAGNIGAVIDVRDIFRKGYAATSAEFSFTDYPTFNDELEIDPTTNLATLSIDVDSLTDDQEAAFAQGVSASIVIYDEGRQELGRLDDDRLVLDDSNVPLLIATDLPYLTRGVALKDGVPYLIQREGRDGLLTTGCNSCVDDDIGYAIGDSTQQFYFTAVDGEADTYFVEHFVYSEGSTWRVEAGDPEFLVFSDDTALDTAHLVLEQDEDGWVQMRLRDTDKYVIFSPTHTDLMVLSDTAMPDRFRLISDDIDWQITDRGTVFNQPIMPPAQLDFAYKGTLRNCSSATLEETIGRSEERTRTTTVGSSESFQLFSSTEQSVDVSIGYEVTAKVGVDVQGIGEAGEEVTVSEDVSFGTSYTTSQTSTTENTWSESQSTTTEVSRTRTLTIPPFTAVEAYDAVKTINDVRVPFTQTLRIMATDQDDGAALSGAEIQSAMLFNFVGGVVTSVEDDYVDVTIRGHALIDQLFEATSNVNELPGACD